MKKEKMGCRWWLIVAAIVLLFGGFFLSGRLWKASAVTQYPKIIANAYGERQYHLSVPGSMVVKLERNGAYGIYYESGLASSLQMSGQQVANELDCSLTGQRTGDVLQGVPDYVQGNRYWSKGKLNSGVLVQSITVNEPDTYRFACHFRNGSQGAQVVVALGPNYVWQFFRIAWQTILPLWAAGGMFFGSILLALLLVFFAVMKGKGVEVYHG